MRGSRSGPPALWRALLRLTIRRSDREFVLGDLAEEYERFGDERAARRWYRSQSIRSSVASLRSVLSAGEEETITRGDTRMGRFGSDIRYAVRSLRRAPMLAALVIGTLGIGTGAAIAIFTVANEVLFEALAYEDPGELVMLWESNRERGWSQVHAAPANVEDWRQRVGAFEDIAHFFEGSRATALATADGARSVAVASVSGNLFTVLGVRPLVGRVFRMDETWEDSEPVTVLSYRAWQQQFNGDRGVLGQTIDLDGTPYTVVGVMPEWFDDVFSDAEMWVTLRWSAARVSSVWFRQAHVVRAVGRLRDGATIEQARSELSAVASQMETENPELNAGMEAGMTPLKSFLVRDERTPLLLLLGAVGLLLLIGISNVANLLLVRSTTRAREVAVRASLGASRGRVVGQLLTESGLLALAGTAAGIGVAWVTLSAVRAIGIPGVPALSLVPDWRVVTFAIGLTGVSALLFGLAPAIRGSRVELRGVLADAGRTGTSGVGALRISNGIVMAQVALAVMLAAAAGLTFRSLAGLSDVADGVNVENVLTFQVTPPNGSYDDAGKALFAINLRKQLATIPGVQSAGVARGFPLTSYAWTSGFSIRGWPPDRAGIEVTHREALPGYFQTMGVPVLDGELFAEVPSQDRAVPVVVNRAFVDAYFPDSSPVGERIAFDDKPTERSYWYEIVGVVENERMSVRDEPVPEIISHLFGDVPSTLSVVVRTTLPPLSIVPAVRSALNDVDSDIPLVNVRTMEEIRTASLSRERFVFAVFGVLAACALLLACVGVYGVAAQVSRTRDREVGIRVALGATSGRILVQFLGSGFLWVGIGLVLGLAGALSAGRVMESLLWGIEPTDPLTLFGVVAVLAFTGLFASYLPARQASRRDPAAVLRDD